MGVRYNPVHLPANAFETAAFLLVGWFSHTEPPELMDPWRIRAQQPVKNENAL